MFLNGSMPWVQINIQRKKEDWLCKVLEIKHTQITEELAQTTGAVSNSSQQTIHFNANKILLPCSIKHKMG